MGVLQLLSFYCVAAGKQPWSMGQMPPWLAQTTLETSEATSDFSDRPHEWQPLVQRLLTA